MLSIEFAVSLLTCICIDSYWLNGTNEASHTPQQVYIQHITTIPHNDWNKRTQKMVLPRNHIETSEQVAVSCCMRLQILRWFLCSLDNSPATPTSKSKHTPWLVPYHRCSSRVAFCGFSRFSLIHGGLTSSHVPQGATETWSTLVLQKMGWYR